DLERTVYYRGEEVEVVASARYYYGEAVADSPLRVSLPDGRLLELRTDARGQATFRFETRDFLSEGLLSFGAVLSEENVSARGDVYLATHGYRASLEIARDVVLAGDSFEVTLKATSPAGEEVARKMILKVLRRTSERRGTWRDELVQEIPLTTDAQTGLAHASLALEKGGTYMLRAEGLDRFLNPVTAERALTVSGDEDSVKLRLLAKSQRTQVGQTLELELVDRAGPGLALLTFEGETILGYRLVRLERGVNRVGLLVDHSHFPNFTVSVAMMLQGEFFTAQSAFDVARGLEVSIVPSESVVRPGGEAQVELLVTDQLGRPVSAELSLAVVDASLFELYPDATPALRAFFEQGARRVAELRTASSCTFSYQGTTVRIDAALLQEAERVIAAQTWALDRVQLGMKLAELGYTAGGGGGPTTPGPMTPGTAGGDFMGPGDTVPSDRPAEIRAGLETTGSDDFFLGRAQKDEGRAARFGGRDSKSRRGRGRNEAKSAAPGSAPIFDADTAFWTPAVVTGENGRATLRFSLPDRATRWRLTSRGVGTGTLLGEATASLTTRSEFFVELHAPHQLTEGDRPRIAARIHNLTGRTGSVTLSLRVTSGENTRVLPVTVELGAEPVVEHIFAPLGAVPAVDLVLELEARAAFTESPESPASELSASTRDEIPVRPWGLEFRATRSGV
ncbi:MAG: alpha-2-macroglobulin family protein, partial [Planctomycetota bacterium]